MDTLTPQAPEGGEFLLFVSDDGVAKLEVRFTGETLWLTQKQMAELFQKDVRTINEHIKNVYDEGELAAGPTIRNFRIVQAEGAREVSRDVAHYNLDVIISVGYRVKSHRGTQFRIWVTQRLRAKRLASDLFQTLAKPVVRSYLLINKTLHASPWKRTLEGSLFLGCTSPTACPRAAVA